MNSSKSPPSMEDFDYFEDDVEPVGIDGLGENVPEGLEEQVARFRAQQRKYSRYLLLVNITAAVVVWFLWDYRDLFSYQFATADQPRDVGDAAKLAPHDLQHNTYVSLSGITEHRGLQQQKVRGLGFNREELWYFRLVGSRGIFIETPAEPDKFDYATRVRVHGRVVDPTREKGYQQLLQMYHHRFYASERPAVRVLQHGVTPGQGQTPFIIVIIAIAVLAVSNLWSVRQLMRLRRMAAGRR